MLAEILKYQECEVKLYHLEQKVNSSKAKKQVSELSALIKDEQNKLRVMGDQATEALKQYSANKKKLDELNAEIQKLINVSLDNIDEKSFKELSDKVSSVSSNIENYQRILSINNKNVDNIASNFAVAKKKINDAKILGNKAKEELAKITSEIEPEKQKFIAELAALEKSVNKELLNKYKHLRADNIFPVFVPLSDSSCGGCRMSVSSAFVNKIKEKGYLECEQCRRLVYIK